MTEHGELDRDGILRATGRDTGFEIFLVLFRQRRQIDLSAWQVDVAARPQLARS